MNLLLILPGREKQWMPAELTADEIRFAWEVAREKQSSFVIRVQQEEWTTEVVMYPHLTPWFLIGEAI